MTWLPILAAVLAAGVAGGAILVVQHWRALRHPPVARRVLPYIRDVAPRGGPGTSPRGLVPSVLVPLAHRGAQSLGEMVGSSASVTRRLERLGTDAAGDVNAFRARQLSWGGLGLTVSFGFALIVSAHRTASIPGLLSLCVAGFVGGFVACDQRLSWQVRQREQRIRAEFPVVAEMLALAVAAGESPTAAIERVTRVGHGPLCDELADVVGAIRLGTPITAALDQMAQRTGVTGVARFGAAVGVAVERGTPLVDVLHAQAADAREEGRRELMESGGRREVAMMVPVVFVLLPITIVFAFYPGLVTLHLVTGG